MRDCGCLCIERCGLHSGVSVCVVRVQCPIEWYHYQCVGLAHQPSGKWICPKCSQSMDSKRHRSDDESMFRV